MIGIYFSGTGNTKFCVDYFLGALNEGKLNSSVESYSIEDKNAIEALKSHDTILLAYPIYYSNLPKIMRDFLENTHELWRGKRVFVLATMGLFSGDGAGLSARLLKRYGALVVSGVHVNMPDCIGDMKALKRPLLKNRELVRRAESKLDNVAKAYLDSHPVREGLSFWYHLAGLFGQRLYFPTKTLHYSDKLTINTAACVGCGTCASLCPIENLSIKNGTAVSHDKCTMCYRCVNHCPQKAITLLGKNVVEQCYIEKYLS